MGSYVVSRTIPASRERVYEFFIDPVAFSQWFVVPGYSTPAERIRIDARPGGRVEAVMVSDTDGTEIPFVVGIDEMEPPATMVLRPGADERVTMTLTDVAGGTEVAYRYEGPSDGPGDAAAASAMLDLMASATHAE